MMWYPIFSKALWVTFLSVLDMMAAYLGTIHMVL